MAERDPEMTPYEVAVAAQRTASDPSRTRLVSANAGSGKTKVLVDRVSRLLLAGADPGTILCLTFTKAAAAEMQARLFKRLGDWSVMDEGKLRDALTTLMETEATPDLRQARGLFAAALETPEGLKVQTIHAFCASILGRFPVEAGVLPGFDLLDDAGTEVLREDVKQRLLADAWADPDGELAWSLAALSRDMADVTLDEKLKWVAGNLREVEAHSAEETVARLARKLGVEPEATSESIAEAAWDSTPLHELQAMLPELNAGTAQNVKVARKVEAALEAAAADKVAAWELYRGVFLTAKLEPAASVVTGKSSDGLKAFFGTKGAADTDEALRVRATLEQRKSASLLVHARRFAVVAERYAQLYRRLKRERRQLDYDDQIELAYRLLTRSEAQDWVRYKLDAGITHILVDEAQDTSDIQWSIIDALREAFDPPDQRGQAGQTFFAVGDEKQSIYGFQGANPASFIEKINAEPEAGVRMGMSFRSAPEILEVVDAVFRPDTALERMFETGLEGETADTTHSARREDRGRVELWPIVPFTLDDAVEDPARPEPLDSLAPAHPKEKLAEQITETIAGWLREGEPIFDRELELPDGSKGGVRPMEAGDIMILVRSRGDFFESMIRRLKAEGVPVAGADRLTLSEATVVKDLIALAKWAVFPGDDLSLAEVLKSPLVGMGEEELFRVAHGREGCLWDSLKGSDSDAVALLERLRESVQSCTPYGFFARALDMEFEGRSFRARLEARLGAEMRDALNEFLGQTIAFTRRTSRSLQHFLHEWDATELELKREQDGRSGEVRIMTVHGAKGLQAPVVILPQTTKAPDETRAPHFMSVDGMVCPLPRTADVPEALQADRERIFAQERREYLRLLYVAMTRAESRLIVCGFGKRAPGPKQDPANPDVLRDPDSWYGEVEAAFGYLRGVAPETPTEEPFVHGGPPEAVKDIAAREAEAEIALPGWIDMQARAERAPLRKVTPSHLLADGGPPAVRSPLTRTDQAERERRFLRGNVIHRLLETLPDVAAEEREAALARTLEGLGFSDAMKARIRKEVLTVMTRFPDIFAEGSRAEVSLAGTGANLPDGLLLNAQIDRLAETDSRVFIVDYKSNRPPPASQDGVSPQYMAQMAAYRELAREIWGETKEIVCALLWTDSAELMELEEERLDAALKAVRARMG